MLAPPGAPAGRDRFALERQARELELLGFIEWELCRRSALYYLENYCWTVDEHNQEEPVQRLVHGPPSIDRTTLQLCRELGPEEDDFLRIFAVVWEQEPLVLVPKSRQMRLTHICMALHGWLAQFHEGRRIAVQSKNFEDADALLDRLDKAWQEQRKRAPHLPWHPYTKKIGRVILPNASVLMGMAQGSDKLRSYTFSAVFEDEMAFQPLAEEAYGACLPTIEGGGKFTGVSSAQGRSFFQRLVFDKAEDE